MVCNTATCCICRKISENDKLIPIKVELKIIKLCSVVSVKFKTYVYWLQNFFKDPWNTFDFITVIGSIIDALVIELGVSKTEVI